MAHFAELDQNNKVLRVIVVDNNDCLDQHGNESEEIGINFCVRLLGGRWVQTSYSSSFRGKFASINDFYDAANNIFVASDIGGNSNAN